MGQTGCVNITDGFEGIGGNSSLAAPGHMAEIPCSAGKYFNAFTCVDCPVDTFTASPGALSCEDCDPGKYTDARQDRRCVQSVTQANNVGSHRHGSARTARLGK